MQKKTTTNNSIFQYKRQLSINGKNDKNIDFIFDQDPQFSFRLTSNNGLNQQEKYYPNCIHLEKFNLLPFSPVSTGPENCTVIIIMKMDMPASLHKKCSRNK